MALSCLRMRRRFILKVRAGLVTRYGDRPGPPEQAPSNLRYD